jgi:hypothetical protein
MGFGFHTRTLVFRRDEENVYKNNDSIVHLERKKGFCDITKDKCSDMEEKSDSIVRNGAQRQVRKRKGHSCGVQSAPVIRTKAVRNQHGDGE